MVLLLYLWENVKKWASSEEMRGEAHHYYGDGKPAYTTDQDYHQMGGLRRLDQAGVRTHFYPEGGWGWIVCACAFLAHVTTSGAQLSAGALHIVLSNKFQDSSAHHWLGPLSWSVSSVCSPLVFNLCRRKNVRILSLVGGFLFPLSLLFTSFATELHQIFFSFGLIGGIGSCIVRESSGVVLGEYFRKRRQFVEQVVMAGTGVGVTLFSLLYLSFSRHLEWSSGFRIGSGLSTICVLLPAFYRTANQYNPNRAQLKNQRQPASPKSPRVSSILVPLGGDICHSLNLFCVPALKPVLWSASISSFGLYAPVFLMSDFGRSEGLSGGSLLLLQTHLGLGLSLGVILGAILTLKKFQCCHVSPRMLCCCTCVLTGLSMIAISSVKGYYGYSLSAWIYGIALGSHLYTLKVLLMELTRTKHWGRVWSCVQSLMSPGILIGSGVTSYLGKPGFYACATCVLIGAGLIGFQLIDLTKCGSPQFSSSLDNDSPIPPAPPPISPRKYGTPTPLAHQIGSGSGRMTGGGPAVIPTGQFATTGGIYPLRRSISLQQPLYPCCRGESRMSDYPPVGAAPFTPILGGGMMHHGYSPYCRECMMTPPPYGQTPPPLFPQMIRSYSLPQTAPLSDSSVNLRLKTTGTQTNPNSPVHSPSPAGMGYLPQHMHPYPGAVGFDRISSGIRSGSGGLLAGGGGGSIIHTNGFILPEDRVIRDLPTTTAKTPTRGAQQSAQQQPPLPSASSSLPQPQQSSLAGSKSPAKPTDSLRKFQPGYKSSVMFASNPQLFPASSSATSTTEERSSSRGGFDVSGTPTPTQHHPPPPPGSSTTPTHHSTSTSNQQQQQRYLFNPQQQQQPASLYHHAHGSSRDYYPQREERKATFLRSQQPPHHHHHQPIPHQFSPHFHAQQLKQRSFDSQKSVDSSGIFPTTPSHISQGRFAVAVEQHKRPAQHQKSHESISGRGEASGPGQTLQSSPKPPLPQSQKPSSAHQQPAFTRHYFDSSKILPAARKKLMQQVVGGTGGGGGMKPTPTISAQVHQQQQRQAQQSQQQQQHQQSQQPHYYPRWTQPQIPNLVARQFDPFADDPDPPYYPAALNHAQAHAYQRGGTPVKISSAEFNIEPPKFNSLRRPGTAGSGSIGGGDTTRGSSISSQLNLAAGSTTPSHHPQQQPSSHHHQPYLPPAPPIHPSYSSFRAQHYVPGSVVPAYPHPFPLHHHQHHPPLRHPMQYQQPPQVHQQHRHRPPSSSKNVSSAPTPTHSLSSNTTPNKAAQQHVESLQQQHNLNVHHRTAQPPPGIKQIPSDGDENDDVDVEVCVVADKTAGKAVKNRRDDDFMMFGGGGPTIINLPPTIISGASPCPYCDVRSGGVGVFGGSRPQSSLSEAGGSSGRGYYAYAAPSRERSMRRNFPGNTNLSLSVPTLQQIYPPLPLGFGEISAGGGMAGSRQHYCSPYGRLLYARRREMMGISPKPPPPNLRELRRRNTWHLGKDFLEQITTSV